jgi:dolichol-phosphate mannosyltransferase
MFALVIPTFNESHSLPFLLSELENVWERQDLIIVVDDSEEVEHAATAKLIEGMVTKGFQTLIIRGQLKGGRGAAILHAMRLLVEQGINFDFVIEADADGSHRAADILAIKNYRTDSDFVIGSRYRQESKIIGWSFSRRLLSKILNSLIPKMLNIETSDITNGLRRYSLKATQIICSYESKNSGFIYLSEQALYLKKSNINPNEIPIIFAPRIAGKSSVSKKDLINSLFGLMNILKMRKSLNA